MAVILLLVFVAGLALLPLVYLQRSRRQWQRSIRADGVAAEARLLALADWRTPNGRRSAEWVHLTFEYRPDGHPAPVTFRVLARRAQVEALSLREGQSWPIHHLPHLSTEAVPDDLDCRATGI
jgi:hypothetical protein